MHACHTTHSSRSWRVCFACKEKADCIANALKQHLESGRNLEVFRQDEASRLERMLVAFVPGTPIPQKSKQAEDHDIVDFGASETKVSPAEAFNLIRAGTIVCIAVLA